MNCSEGTKHHIPNTGQLPQLDKPWLAIDNTGGAHDGFLYAAWVALNGTGTSQIWFCSSTDGGTTWPASNLRLLDSENDPGEVAIPPQPYAAHFLEYPMTAVAPNGDVYVVWADLHAGILNGSTFKFIRTSDAGNTVITLPSGVAFTYVEQGRGIRIWNIPSLAINPTNGNLLLAYTDAENGPNTTPRVKTTRSTNGATDWSPPMIRGIVGPNSTQCFPWLAVNETGKFIIAYLSLTDVVNVNLIETTDGGETFGTPQLLTPTPSALPSGDDHHPYDYMGVAASGNLVFPVWTDYRVLGPYRNDIYLGYDPPLKPTNVQVGKTKEGGQFYPKVTWTANSDSDMASYKIWRWIDIDPLPYQLITTVQHPTNSYVDHVATVGNLSTAYYKITAVDLTSHESNFSNTVSIGLNYASKAFADNQEANPREYNMEQTYPNPFNPTTQIKFGLPEDSFVSLNVFDVLGRKIGELVNGFHPAGFHTATWNVSDASSGVYFAHFTVTDAFGKLKFSKINKLVLTK